MKVSIFIFLISSAGNAAFASGITKVGCRATDLLVELAYPKGEVQNIFGDIRNLSVNSTFPINDIKRMGDVISFDADPDGNGLKQFIVLDFFVRPVLEIRLQTESGVSQVVETMNCSVAN